VEATGYRHVTLFSSNVANKIPVSNVADESAYGYGSIVTGKMGANWSRSGKCCLEAGHKRQLLLN
jgi:hypothetical protein